MFLRLAPLAPATLPVLPPDIVWDEIDQRGDFARAVDPSQGGVGGLQAMNPIGTAATMLLMTDARCPVAMLKLGLGGDRRGWPGDGFDIETQNGEAALGCYWWAMRRDVLDQTVAQAFRAEGLRALQPLKTQSLVTSITGNIAELDIPEGLLEICYKFFGTDGRPVFAGNYRPLWNRSGGL